MSINPFSSGSNFLASSGGSSASDSIVGPFDSLADLKSYDTTSTSDNVIANVNGFGIVRFDKASSATANDLYTVAPTVGGGRWFKVTTTSSGKLLTVNGDGSADFTTVSDAITFAGTNDVVIQVMGDTSETTTASIIAPTSGQKITIINNAKITLSNSKLISADNSSGPLKLNIFNGQIDFAFSTSNNSLVELSNANTNGFIRLQNTIINNNSTANSCYIFNQASSYINVRNCRFELPDRVGCGIISSKLTLNEAKIIGGGATCSQALVCTDRESIISDLVVEGEYTSSGAAFELKAFIDNMIFSSGADVEINVFGPINGATAKNTGDVKLNLGTNSSRVNNTAASSISGLVLDLYINGVSNNISDIQVRRLTPFPGPETKNHFDNVALLFNLSASGGFDTYTNLTSEGDIFVTESNQTFMNVNNQSGGNNKLLVQNSINNTIIKSLRTDDNLENFGDNTSIYDVIAYNDSNYQYFRPLNNKNYVINGEFSLWQRASQITSSTQYNNSDGGYTSDRWILLSDGNNIVDLEKDSSFAPDDATNSCKFTVNTGNKKFGLLQVLSNANSMQMIKTGIAALQFKAATSVTAAGTVVRLKAAILSWDGTADSVVRDCVSSWNASGTNPTLASNWNYKTTTENFDITNNWEEGLFKILDPAMSSSDRNLGVFIWLDNIDDDLSTESINISAIQLENAKECSVYQQPVFEHTFNDCQKYFQKSYDHGVSVGTITSVGEVPVLVSGVSETAGTIDTINRTAQVFFATKMNNSPFVQVYSPNSGSPANIYDYTNSSDIASTGMINIGSTSAHGINGTIPLNASNVAFHYIADAEI